MEQKGADPRPEDGHVDIANELVEQLCRVNLTAYESRVLWFIFRKTYGWHKERDRISYSQFEKGTRLTHRHIGRTLRKLEARNMVIGTPLGNSRAYSIQNDYTKWKTVPNEVPNKTVPPGAESLPNKVLKSVPSEVHTKEKKETNKRKGDDDYISLKASWDGEDDLGVATKITLKDGKVVSVEDLWFRVILRLTDNATSSEDLLPVWLSDVWGMGVVDGRTFCIGVPEYYMEQAIERYIPLIEETVLDITGLPLKVEAAY